MFLILWPKIKLLSYDTFFLSTLFLRLTESSPSLESQVSTPLQSYSLWFILPVALSFTTAYQGSQRTLDSHTNQPFRCYQHLCAANASPADSISPDPFSSKETDPISLDPFSSRDSEMAEQRRWQGGRWRRTCSSASGKADHQRRQRKRLTAVALASLRWDGEDRGRWRGRGRGRQCWQIPSFSLLRLRSFSPTLLLPLLTLRLWRRRQYDAAGKFGSSFFWFSFFF